MTAADAAATFSASENREGWEVIIPRRIASKEIHRIRSLPQVVGWRYFPAAKGSRRSAPVNTALAGRWAARLRARLGSPDE